MVAKRFASWAGVSSLPQAKLVSLDDQLKTNKEHIERHGGQCVAELVVPGESRNIVLFEDAAKRMEAYAKLKDLIDQRAIDVLIFLDRSRLGRKASLSMAVIELCHEAGIVTYETDAPPPSLDTIQDGYDEMLLGAIKSVGAQQEVKKFQARSDSGRRGRAMRGEFAGVVPWGWTAHYEASGKRIIELDPVAAALIREIFVELYLGRGMGKRQICDELNGRGVPSPRGSQWKPTNIANLFGLLNRYAGWAEYNTSSNRPYVKAPGKFPAILSDDEVAAIRQERHIRRSARRAVSTTYLFSLCVWCGTCGTRMKMDTSPARKPTRRDRIALRCGTRLHANASVVESRIYQAVRNAFVLAQDPAYRQHLLQDDGPGIDPILHRIAAAEDAIAKLEAGRLRADDAYTIGAMDRERYRRQVERINAQVADHEAQIDRLRSQMAAERHAAKRGLRLEEVARDGLWHLENPDVKAANVWMRQHVQVWLMPDGVLDVRFV